MKIDLHKLVDQAVKFGGPIVLAAIAHQAAAGKLGTGLIGQAVDEVLATGKLDVKALSSAALVNVLEKRLP